MSKPANPMELVDRYLQAVRFWLPKTRREEELVAEFGEDLRSQLDARRSELGHPLGEADVSEILKRCGHPILVAGRFRPQRHLIGPVLFPVYEFVLKMVVLWILVPVFLFIVGPVNLANAGGHWGIALARTLGNLWSGLFVAAGVVTVVFAVLEYFQVQWGLTDKWNPNSLPPLQKVKRKTSLVGTVCELMFGTLWFIWLLLLPYYPVLILGPAAAFLKPAPLWHIFYLPILALAVLGLLRSSTILARPQWTSFPLWTQLLTNALALILVNYMLHAALQTPSGEWHPFLVLADSAKNSAQYIRVAAIVNVALLISLASVWLGISIALVVETWEFLRYWRKQAFGPHQPASLRAQ